MGRRRQIDVCIRKIDQDVPAAVRAEDLLEGRAGLGFTHTDAAPVLTADRDVPAGSALVDRRVY